MSAKKKKKPAAKKPTPKKKPLAAAKRAVAKKQKKKKKSKPAVARPRTKRAPKPEAVRASRADGLAKRGSALMHAGAYNKALELFDEALALDPKHLFALYGAAYSLGALDHVEHDEARIDRILQLADALIARTPEESLWPYLQAHMFPRGTLRFARNARAWWWMKRSKSQADLERALAEVDHGLSLKAPTEGDQVLLGLWDTKVRVLLALERQDEAFAIVQRLPSNLATKDVMESAAYRAWEQAGGASALLVGAAEETGAQAVLRLRDAIAKYGHPTYAALVFSEPIDPLEIAMAERKLGVVLPPSYVAFVTKHGCFKLLWDKPSETSPTEIMKAFPSYRGCRQLLPPAEIASETASIRKAYKRADDPMTAGMLGDSLLFHENYYRDNFFTFRVSSATERGGEMTVHAFFHDDAYEWRVRPVSFDEHLREWANGVLGER